MKRITYGLVLLASLPVCAATIYNGDGVLSADLELERWYINRCRYSPEREADSLSLVNTTPGGHPDYDACEDVAGLNNFGTTTNAWAVWIQSKPPVAPNALLSTAAHKHGLDMAATENFTHYSPSSTYYPLNSLPGARMTAEGYTWNTWSENLAAGYTTILAAQNALFIDGPISNRAHRMIMLNASYREIGLGFVYTNSFYQQYYIQDYAASSTNHFFTDTVYFDANSNSVYDSGEGVGNIEIHFWNDQKEAKWFDRSQASGNFAVPINDLPDKSNVWVEIRNAGGTTNITVPLGYSLAGDTTLTNNESLWFGTYRQPIGSTNVGFRNVMPWTEQTAVGISPSGITLTFSSLRRATYMIESTDIGVTSWQRISNVTATSDVTAAVVPLPVGQRMFRVSLMKD